MCVMQRWCYNDLDVDGFQASLCYIPICSEAGRKTERKRSEKKIEQQLQFPTLLSFSFIKAWDRCCQRSCNCREGGIELERIRGKERKRDGDKGKIYK